MLMSVSNNDTNGDMTAEEQIEFVKTRLMGMAQLTIQAQERINGAEEDAEMADESLAAVVESLAPAEESKAASSQSLAVDWTQ